MNNHHVFPLGHKSGSSLNNQQSTLSAINYEG